MMRESLRELYGVEGSLLRAVSALSGGGCCVLRFRAVAVGLSDAGLGADRPRAALDGRAAAHLRR